MSRVEEETKYWNKNASDPEVDIKYIADVNTQNSLKDLGKLSGDILEIGCGVGRLMRDFTHGTDISEKMLEIAQLRRPLCFFKLNDGRTLPYDSESFDFVYSYLLFQHLKPDAVQSYIDEANRVLRPGGKLIFQFIEGAEREPYSNHYSRQEIDSFLERFKNIKYKQSVAYDGWTICEGIK